MTFDKNKCGYTNYEGKEWRNYFKIGDYVVSKKSEDPFPTIYHFFVDAIDGELIYSKKHEKWFDRNLFELTKEIIEE